MRCSLCHQELSINLSVIELFFPPIKCCRTCRQKFTRIKRTQACLGCGRAQAQTTLCSDCQNWQTLYPQLLANRALYLYDAALKDWMQQYKFYGDYQLRFTFAAELKQALADYHGYLVCPIPLADERFATRGFNQVTEMLRAARVSYSELLERKTIAQPQSKKNRHERLLLPQPFSLAVPPEKIKNKKVLLVDDVYTTGRTLFHAAEIFWENDAEVVQSLTLAR